MVKALSPTRTRTSLLFVTVITLVVAAFYATAYHAGLRAVLNHLFEADAIWLLLIVGAQSVAYWAYVIPYKHVFKLSYRGAIRHSFEGFHPLSTGGGTKYDLLAHCSLGEKAKAYYLGFWEYAALAPVVLVAAIYGYINGGVPSPLSLPWIIGVPAGSLIFGLAIIFREHLAKFPKAHKILDFMVGMLKQQNPKELIILMLGMILYWTGEIFALWGALQLFDMHLGWFALLIAYASGYVVSRRSLPLGGAGLILVTLAFSLHWVGTALSVALLAALAYQVFNLLMPALYRRAALNGSS